MTPRVGRATPEPDGSLRSTFLSAARDAWAQAAARAGGAVDHDVRVAGLGVRLRLAGPALCGPLGDALTAPARATAGPPALEVLAWDSATTGVSMPPSPWPPAAYGPHGRVAGWFDDEVQATYQHGTRSLSVVEPATGRALFWTADAAGMPAFERAAPLRAILHAWLTARGLGLTHAAAVERGGSCVLLAGPSGAGKSSAVLACLESRLGHLADDYCVLDDEDPPTAHALYTTVKARADTLTRLGVPEAYVDTPPSDAADKALIHLGRHRPAALAARAGVRAVLVPRVTGRPDSRIVPVAPAEALAALAPSTLLQLPGAGPAAFARLARLVRTVPTLRLEAGTRADQVPELLGGLLP